MNRFVLHAFPFVLSLSALACSSQTRVLAPEKGGDDWRELKSAHFVLKTDVDEADAQAVSASLETMLAGLSEIGFASSVSPDVHIDVVHFARASDYKQVASTSASATYLSRGRHDFEDHPLILIGGDYVRSVHANVEQVLARMLVRVYYPQAPDWLREGLSEYVETLSLDEGEATVGKVSHNPWFFRPLWSTRRDPLWHAHHDPAGPVVLFPLNQATPPSALVRMGTQSFYACDGYSGSDPSRDTMRERLFHYRSAWALVHLLMGSPAYRPAFDAYLSRLRAGEASDSAWASTVGALPEARLDADFRASLAPAEVDALRTPYTPEPVPAATVRSIDGGEAHVLWARMRNWATAEQREATTRDLEAARSLKPVDVERTLVEAMFATQNGSRATGEALLRDARMAHPEDPRLLGALGWLLAERDAPATEIEPIAEPLRRVAATAGQLDLLGHVSLRAGDADAAIRYERSAVALDPNCADCFIVASEGMLAKGMLHEALTTATFALGIASDDDTTAKLNALIARATKP